MYYFMNPSSKPADTGQTFPASSLFPSEHQSLSRHKKCDIPTFSAVPQKIYIYI